jgi:hypothetical protein
MVWFKTDDGFWRHRKVRKLGADKLAAAGLWELSGTWCADNLTDGFVPQEQVKDFGDKRLRFAKKLVEVGLWTEAEHDGEAGFQFHEWAAYQPTKASIEAERSKWQQKKAAQRKGTSQPDPARTSPGDNLRDTGETPPETPQGTDEETPEGRPPRFPDPVPVPVPSSGSVEGGSYVPARVSAPPPRCPKHLDNPADGPCRACGDARREREAWDTQHAAQAAETERADRLAIRACSLCDGDGWRWHDPTARRHGVTNDRCTHQPIPRQEPA